MGVSKVKVKLKTSLSGLTFSYKKGDEVEIDEKKGRAWIAAGVATEIRKKDVPKKTRTTKPKNEE